MYLIVKRILDIFFSTLAIFLLSPVLILIIVVLKFSAEGEVFYLQERVGFNNKNFMIFKFATMIKNSPNIGTGDVTLRNDPRVTKIGKLLRETKLNEIPQTSVRFSKNDKFNKISRIPQMSRKKRTTLAPTIC